jgi:hypothetical protein
MTVTLRSETADGATTKGSPLSHEELDNNFLFTQDGSTTVRTIAGKLEDYPSPQDYGFVPTGTADMATPNTKIATKLQSFGTIDVPAGSLAAASKLWTLIDGNQKDVYIIILGDSTGNDSTDWPRVWAGYLGTAAPTHTVKYRLWDASTFWPSATTVSTGSGSKIIHIDNVSISGANSRQFQGAARANIYSEGRFYDLAIINHGHNMQASDAHGNFCETSEAAAVVKLDNPHAQVVAILQNPRTDQPDYSANAVAAWRTVAALQGIGLIDVYSEFIRLGSPAGLYTDAVHPNDVGQKVWAGVVLFALGRPYKMHSNPAQIASSLVQRQPNLIPNPSFNEWESSNPTYTSLSNVTAERDYEKFESGAFSVKLTATGSSPIMTWDLSDKLPLVRGQWLTFAARIWYPSSANAACGQIAFSGTILKTLASTSATGAASRNTPTSDGSGGWCWVVTSVYVPVNELQLGIRVTAGASASDVCWVDRVWMGRGLLPYDIDHTAIPKPDIAEYYSSKNVGLVSGFTGTLTVSTNDIDVASGSPTARAFINVYNLVPGASYTATWNTVAGSGTVFARELTAGVGTVITSATFATETLTWTASAESNSLALAGGSDSWDLEDFTIVKAGEPAVTQATDKATGVTLNTLSGQITMNNAALAADAIVSFTLTNSKIEASDIILLNHISGGTLGSYVLNAAAAAGSATIYVANRSAGSLGEAVVIGFTVVKSRRAFVL